MYHLYLFSHAFKLGKNKTCVFLIKFFLFMLLKWPSNYFLFID